MKSNEIRSRYLEFFEKRNHVVVPSSSLIPFEDPTLLFTSAGMVQFKKFWATETPLPYKRATSCQKCLRAGGKDSDLEKIGLSGRHHTFFEMLGNFSFGDYFKEEAISWAFEFVTEHLKIDKEKLWVSYYEEDIETLKIWKKFFPETKIIPLGKKDNFWGPAGDTGPCGPCTEIYIDSGIDPSCQNNNCKPGCDCNRFLEFWNLVFPQYNQQANGQLLPLKRRGVDTGMGLERISRIMQEKKSNYETDLFIPLITKLEEITNQKYTEKTLKEFRIICDHIRAAIFLIGDGVYPENEGRGYVLKRIIRRAHFQGTNLGIKKPFLIQLIEPVVSIFKNVYPEIEKNSEEITRVIYEEENKFIELLASAKKIFDSDTAKLTNKTIPGELLFRWYDTYGIPRDLISELAEEKNFIPDWDLFEEHLKNQQNLARKKSIFELKRKPIFEPEHINETIFTGYDRNEQQSKLVAFYFIPDKESWEIVLDSSPFYPEKGGQVGDTGFIQGEKWSFEVIDTQVDPRGVIFHSGKFLSGSEKDIKKSENVIAKVSRNHRLNVSANHTATHLLHYCLRKFSNNQAKQAGSYVSPERLRFDFVYPEALNREKIEQIEKEINKIIFENHPVKIEEMAYQDAIKKGAIALFTEKYEEKVRVINIGDFHSELCGGIHVSTTSEIGIFKIISFSSIGENLKRVEAITKKSAYDWMNKNMNILLEISELLKTSPENIVSSINKLKKQIKELETRIESILEKTSVDIYSTLKNNKKNVKIENQSIEIISGRVDDVPVNQMGKIADTLASGMRNTVIFLAGAIDEKLVMVCKVTSDISSLIQASTIVKNIATLLNGSGGGKPEFAQGAGKDIARIDQIITKIPDIIQEIFNK